MSEAQEPGLGAIELEDEASPASLLQIRAAHKDVAAVWRRIERRAPEDVRAKVAAVLREAEAVLSEVATEGAAGPEVAAEGAVGPEVAAEGAVGPEVAAEGAVGPEVAAEGAVGPEVAAEGAVGPEVAAEGAAGPEVATETPQAARRRRYLLLKRRLEVSKALYELQAELRGRQAWEAAFYRDGRLAIVRAQDPITIRGAIDHVRLEEFFERYVRQAEAAYERLQYFLDRAGALTPEEKKVSRKPWEQPYSSLDTYRELLWGKVAKRGPRVRRE